MLNLTEKGADVPAEPWSAPRGGVLRRLGPLTRPNAADAGFTLIELVVSMMITMIVLTSMVGLLVGSLQTIGLAKQRQAATGLATRVLEQLRALDYATVSSGLSQADLTGDPNIIGSGATARLVLTRQGIDEPLKTYVTGPDRLPLFPHRPSAPTVLNGVSYTVASYVTQNAVGTNAAYNLTAVVSWTSSVSRGPKVVVQRSTTFSPAGCLSTATHAYAGPCQAFFDAQAGLSTAGFSLTNADDGSADVPGTNGKKLELALPAMSAGLASEQTIKLVGTTQTTEGTATGSTTSSSGGTTASASVDNDPSSAGTTTSGPTNVPAQTSTTRTLSGLAGTFGVTPTTADTGSAYASVVTAGSSCVDEQAAPYANTGQPCISGLVQPTGSAGTLTANLTGTALVRSLPVFNLATAAGTGSARAVTARLLTGSGFACPATTGAGCVTAGASRTLGTVTFGGLPAAAGGDTMPTNWPSYGLLQVTGLTERSLAETGVGSLRAAVNSRSGGQLQYYDPAISNVRTINLAIVTTAAVYDLPAFTATYRSALGQVVVTMDPTISVNPAALPVLGGTAPCQVTVCSVRVPGVSAVRASAAYTVAVNGVTLTRFAITADVGALIAQASWQAAPSA